MSENKTNPAILLIEQKHSLENRIADQQRIIGGLEQNISNLQSRLDEKQPKVIIEEGQPIRYNSCGELVRRGTKVIKLNMEEASELIAKHVNEENEVKLKETEKELAKLNRKLETAFQNEKSLISSHARAKNVIQDIYDERLYEAKQELKESNTNYKHQIEDLKKELKKVKEDKTDEQVEKRRQEEVSKLKARVKTLEREIKRLSTQGWLGKTWDRITNRKARVEAIKQVEEEKALAPIEAKEVSFSNPFRVSLPGW